MTDLQYITTLKDYEAAVDSLTSAPLAVDTETKVRKEYATVGSALDCHTAEISLLIVKHETTPPVVFDLVWLRSLGYDPFKLGTALANAEYLIGANFRFDLKFLRNEFNIWYKRIYDVIVASKLIGNATGSKVARQLGHGYGDICRELLNVHITGKEDLRKSSWAIGLDGRNLESEWWQGKVTYAATDTQYLFPIKSIQEKVLCTPMPHTPLLHTNNHSDEWGLGMESSLKREMAIVPVVAKMEYNGFPVSREMMTTFQAGVKEELDRVGAYLSIEFNLDEPIDGLDGRLIPTKKAGDILRSSHGLLRLINKGLGLGKIDNTQGEALRRMIDILDTLSAMDNPDMAEVFVDEAEEDLYSEFMNLEQSVLIQMTPVVKAILDFKKLTKQDGMDLRRYINPATGRIHASYDQLGAATGRFSNACPNLQQQSGRTKIKVRMRKGAIFQ